MKKMVAPINQYAADVFRDYLAISIAQGEYVLLTDEIILEGLRRSRKHIPLKAMWDFLLMDLYCKHRNVREPGDPPERYGPYVPRRRALPG